MPEEQGEEDNRCELPGPARGGYKDESFDEDLESVLTGEAEEVVKIAPVQSFLPLPLKISERNLELGYLIGPAAASIGKSQFEVGGLYTIDLRDGNFSLTDFIIPRGLPVQRGSILIAEHYPQAAAELKKINDRDASQRRLSAMFHIHPEKGGRGLFHSGDDNAALASLLNKMAEVNKISSESPYQLIQSKVKKRYGDNELVLRGDELSDAIIRFVFPDDELFFKLLKDFGLKPDRKSFDKQRFLGELLEVIDHKTTEPRTIRFATSFVFENDRKGPFVRMQIEEKFALTGTVQGYFLTNPKLEVILKGVNLPTEEEAVALVKDRVKFPEAQPFFRRKKGARVWVGDGEGDGEDLDWDGVVSAPGTYMPKHGFATGALTAGGGSPAGAYVPYQPPPKTFVKKVDFAQVGVEEIAGNFAVQAFGYLCQYWDKRCRYSQYMDQLFDRLGRFVALNQKVLPGNIRQQVSELGDLVEDGPEMEKPLTPYPYRTTLNP